MTRVKGEERMRGKRVRWVCGRYKGRERRGEVEEVGRERGGRKERARTFSEGMRAGGGRGREGSR